MFPRSADTLKRPGETWIIPRQKQFHGSLPSTVSENVNLTQYLVCQPAVSELLPEDAAEKILGRH